MFEESTKFSLHWTELNNFNARLTERLVRRYIEKVRIPTLLKQGWDEAIFEPQAWFGYNKNEEQTTHKIESLQIFWHLEEDFFISKGFCPTKKFLDYFKVLTNLLENTPDGFLVKIRKNGRTKRTIDALNEFGIRNMKWTTDRAREFASEKGITERLSIVEGEIEVVEVKTGKAIIPAHQMISYRKAIEQGYSLRFFHVNILSIEHNDFEIDEKLVTSNDDLEIVQLQERKRSWIKK